MANNRILHKEYVFIKQQLESLEKTEDPEEKLWLTHKNTTRKLFKAFLDAPTEDGFRAILDHMGVR